LDTAAYSSQIQLDIKKLNDQNINLYINGRKEVIQLNVSRLTKASSNSSKM